MAALVTNLYDMEEGLQALLDTAELVPVDQQEAFRAEVSAALIAAADKRDRTANFLGWLEAQQEYAAKEIKRLQTLKAHYASVQERVESFVSYAIDRLGKDAKGAYKRLEGHTTVLSLRKSPASVEITNEAMVPLDLKRATMTLPASILNDVLHALDDDLRETVQVHLKQTLKIEVDKRGCKSALDAGVEIAGARLADEKYGVVRS